MKRTQSYSSISLYKKCPRAWEWRYVHRQYGPPSVAADRGTELHALLEEFFLGGPYPSANKTLAPWRRYMENLLTFKPSPEANFAVGPDWAACEFDSPDAYIRGTADLVYTDDEGVRHILDWKSGRIYPDHVEQGKTYVALDQVDNEGGYETEFVYLDLPVQTVKHKYTIGQKMVFIGKLCATVDAIAEDTTYEPTPSPDSCKYCSLSYKKGGNCTRAS